MWNTVETVERTIIDGFSLFGPEHLLWIILMVVVCVIAGVRAARSGGTARAGRILAILMIADEIFKYVIVALNHVTIVHYLPFQLCSISIIIAIIHAFADESGAFGRYAGNFLYLVGLPGCVSAVLFPAWTALPAFGAMSIHSFSVHIMLIVYVVIKTAGGDISPELKTIPVSVIALLMMAWGIYAFDVAADVNFMYLVHISPGSPMAAFEALGNYRIGYGVILAVLIIVLYMPAAIHCLSGKNKRELNRINKREEITMNEELLCPVCGRHYFTEKDAYEICPVCGWEDDKVQRQDPDYRGGANRMSLNEARQKYSEEAEL